MNKDIGSILIGIKNLWSNLTINKGLEFKCIYCKQGKIFFPPFSSYPEKDEFKQFCFHCKSVVYLFKTGYIYTINENKYPGCINFEFLIEKYNQFNCKFFGAGTCYKSQKGCILDYSNLKVCNEFELVDEKTKEFWKNSTVNMDIRVINNELVNVKSLRKEIK